MTKQSRFKQTYRANASKLHQSIGNMLRASEVFKNYKIYQEYPVNRVSAYFDSGREHFDWCILDLQVVIECHGQQHYAPVKFGGITKEEAESNFLAQRTRDETKKQAAEAAGWTYVVFKYNEKITIYNLLDKINSHEPSSPICNKAPQLDQQQVHRKKEQLEKARQYRKKRYQWLKRWRKNEDY